MTWHLLLDHADRARDQHVDATNSKAVDGGRRRDRRRTPSRPTSCCPADLPVGRRPGPARRPVRRGVLRDCIVPAAGQPRRRTVPRTRRCRPMPGCGSGCDGVRREHELPPTSTRRGHARGRPRASGAGWRSTTAQHDVRAAATEPGDALRWAKQILEPTDRVGAAARPAPYAARPAGPTAAPTTPTRGRRGGRARRRASCSRGCDGPLPRWRWSSTPPAASTTCCWAARWARWTARSEALGVSRLARHVSTRCDAAVHTGRSGYAGRATPGSRAAAAPTCGSGIAAAHEPAAPARPHRGVHRRRDTRGPRPRRPAARWSPRCSAGTGRTCRRPRPGRPGWSAWPSWPRRSALQPVLGDRPLDQVGLEAPRPRTRCRSCSRCARRRRG